MFNLYAKECIMKSNISKFIILFLKNKKGIMISTGRRIGKSNVIFNFSKCLFLAVIFLLSSSMIDRPAKQEKNPDPCAGIKIRGSIFEYGLAHGDLGTNGFDEQGDTYANYTNIEIFEKTTNIPLKDGNIMYIKYKIYNIPESDNSQNSSLGPFYLIVKNPPFKYPNGRIYNSTKRAFYLSYGQKEYISDYYWAFLDKFSFEMVSGEHVFQIFYKTCLLAEQKFRTY